MHRETMRQRQAPRVGKAQVLEQLSTEFKLSRDRIATTLRSVGISLDQPSTEEDVDLFREVVACKARDRSGYSNIDEPGYAEALDEQLRSFDEIYVDTAPIIQEDWFIYFANDAAEILKRRKKKLLVLEKTLEELHGLKNNPEKDRDVRIRATIRPDLLRQLARRGVVRIGDTGSGGIADDHLVDLFRRIGVSMDLLLITQDRGLSERIVRLGDQMERKPSQITPTKPTWYQRLLGRQQSEDEAVVHRMVACKLTERGKLKRLYICPQCDESYYDNLHACGGVVLCGRCYLRLKEEEDRQEEANRQKREAELKREEERQRSLEEEERRLEAMRPKQTVAQRIIVKKKRFYRRATLVLGVLVIILLLLLILL
jgi:rRNA-processing protein FCF1/ferredoxin